jgi:hypothetical protein
MHTGPSNDRSSRFSVSPSFATTSATATRLTGTTASGKSISWAGANVHQETTTRPHKLCYILTAIFRSRRRPIAAPRIVSSDLMDGIFASVPYQHKTCTTPPLEVRYKSPCNLWLVSLGKFVHLMGGGTFGSSGSACHCIRCTTGRFPHGILGVVKGPTSIDFTFLPYHWTSIGRICVARCLVKDAKEMVCEPSLAGRPCSVNLMTLIIVYSSSSAFLLLPR